MLNFKINNMDEPSIETARRLPFELSKDESVIQEFPRSKVPLFFIIFVSLTLGSFFFLNFIDLATGGPNWFSNILGISTQSAKGTAPIFAALSGVSIAGGVLAGYIYSANRMFLTNEHVVRIKQDGLVATDKKVISHLNIEDIKARQNIIGSIFGYGLLTMSTEGQNATYEINFIRNPFDQVRIATDARDEYQQAVIDSGGRAIPLAEER